MRVTMINKYYPPHLGGIEVSLERLATALARRPEMDVRVLVANEAKNDLTETIDGVEILRVGRLFAYASTPIAPGMTDGIRNEATRPAGTDLFHLHFPYPWGEVAWMRAATRLPSVVTYHSDIVRQKRMLAAYRPFLERFLDRIDLVIASAPPMVEHSPFLSRVAEKCRFVPFGIPVERFDATPENVARAEAFRAEHERPVVLFVGRLIYYKGADVLVRAMRHVDADLVIIGRGPLEGELRELAVAQGVNRRVTWIPGASDEDLAAWYRAAAVLCLPSVAPSEAYGLVQLEAHASGTPVVSTNLPTAVPWVNQDGVTGLVVPVGDAEALGSALSKLVSDEGLRSLLGAQAEERARREFTVERMVDRTIEVYEELLGGRS